MQTSVEAIEIIDRNKSNKETRMMSIRTVDGELKSHLLRRLLRDREVVTIPRPLVWELADEVKDLAIQCGEQSFPNPALAGGLAYLADHPDAAVSPGVLRRLLERRAVLRKQLCRLEKEEAKRVPWLWEC